MPDRRETLIVQEIRARLGLRRDVKLVRANSGEWADAQGQHVRTFSVNGMPDLIGLVTVRTPSGRPLGLFLGIEVKVPGKKQEPEQYDAQTIIEALGGIYLVAYGADHAAALLEAAVLGKHRLLLEARRA